MYGLSKILHISLILGAVYIEYVGLETKELGRIITSKSPKTSTAIAKKNFLKHFVDTLAVWDHFIFLFVF